MRTEERENVDNILFIGNGFDLSNGMKTSYANYLDSLKIEDDMLENIKLVFEFESVIEYLENFTFKKYIGRNQFHLINKNGIAILGGNNRVIFTPEKCDQKTYWEMVNCSYTGFEISFKSLKREDAIFYTYMSIVAEFKNKQGEIFLDIKCSDLLKEFIIKNSYEEFLKTSKSIGIFVEKEHISLFSIYLQILRKKTYISSEFYKDIKELELAGENWIDIENILYENQFSFFRSALQISQNLNKLKICNKYKYNNLVEVFNKIYYYESSEENSNRKEKNKINLDDDFKKFKQSFANYVGGLQKPLENNFKINDYVKNIYNKFQFNKIYNFNYSNYIDSVVKEIELKNKTKILVDNIHGSIKDGEKIVFGTNHYLFKQDNEEHNKIIKENQYTDVLISNSEENYKLTKIYQVLELSDSRERKILNKFDSFPILGIVNSLTILGHSIGKQDFEYMHTIIMTNPKEIVLNILYSTKVDNRGALTDAVYEMLGKYEELHGDVTIHKMILENRIKFFDVETLRE